MDVVIYAIVTILQVLTFRNTVCANENIDLRRAPRQQDIFPFGDRRKTGKYRIEVGAEFRDGRLALYNAGNFRRI